MAEQHMALREQKRVALLDLFCGGGGASMGYHHAGFDVFGVDIKHHDNYPFPLVTCDWREGLDRFVKL